MALFDKELWDLMETVPKNQNIHCASLRRRGRKSIADAEVEKGL